MQFRRERVRIETARHEIEGTLQLPHEGFRSRLTDFLNAQGDDFLPLTDATVTYIDSTREPESHDYLALSARHVVAGDRAGNDRGRRRAGPGLHGVNAAARRVTASSNSAGVVPTLSRT